jgi:hypothetical protein
VPATIDSAELRLSFGDPDSVAASPNPFDEGTPMLTWIYDGFEIRFAESAAPSGFMMRAPGERTVRGISVGDAARAVLHRSGEPSARTESGYTDVRESEVGALQVIDFVVSADTVRRIYIGRALPW